MPVNVLYYVGGNAYVATRQSTLTERNKELAQSEERQHMEL
jgi:hypothetical protein